MTKSPAWGFVILLALTAIAFPQITTAQSPATIKDYDPNLRQAAASTPLLKPSSNLSPQPLKDARDIQEPGTKSPSSSGLLSTFFALGIVLALFLGLATLAKKAWPPLTKKKLPKEVLQLIATVEFQPKQQWMLMRFGGKLLLVSQQPGETRLVSEISDLDEIDRIIALCEKPHPSDAAFQGLSLSAILGKRSSITG